MTVADRSALFAGTVLVATVVVRAAMGSRRARRSPATTTAAVGPASVAAPVDAWSATDLADFLVAPPARPWSRSPSACSSGSPRGRA